MVAWLYDKFLSREVNQVRSSGSLFLVSYLNLSAAAFGSVSLQELFVRVRRSGCKIF